jgi:heme/copper-type cytochrome/quinol oxidase subunit 1
MGGVVFWAPKLWGRRIPDMKAMPLALLGVLAVVLAAFPYFIAGFADQPAASPTYDYSGPAELWNVLSLVGHGLMALVVLAFVGLAIASLRGGADPEVGDDPWGAHTIEWSTTSPAPGNNFREVPTVRSPEPMLDLQEASQERPS